MTDKLELLTIAKSLTGETDINALINAAAQVERYLNPTTKSITTHPLYRTVQADVVDFTTTLAVAHPVRGSVPLGLYDYQRCALKTLAATTAHTVAIANGRQLGWTTMLAAFMLHEALTKPGSTNLLLHHKLVAGLEVLDRMKIMLECRPDVVVKKDNSGLLEFENGSKIIARATTRDGARGLSLTNVAIIDAAYISHKSLEDALAMLQPCVATGSKLILQSTPKYADDPFHEFYKTAELQIHQGWKVHPDRDELWAKPIRDQIGALSFAVQHDALFVQPQD